MTAGGAGVRSAFFMSKGLRLHYLERGDPAAPLMIMLHGGLEHAHSWDELAPAYARDYRVICPDLRGHGDSAWAAGGGYAVLDGVYDLHRLIRHLDAGPAVLVGHSFGGNIAVRYAAIAPDDVVRLVSIEGLALGGGRDPVDTARLSVARRLRELIALQADIDDKPPRVYAGAAEAVARLMAVDPRLPHHTATAFAAHALRPVPGGASWKYDPNIRGVGMSDISPDELRLLWAAIRCPTLLIYGAESWASNPAEDGRADYFRDARVVLVADAGHNVHHHQPAAVAAAIAAFIQGQ